MKYSLKKRRKYTININLKYFVCLKASKFTISNKYMFKTFLMRGKLNLAFGRSEGTGIETLILIFKLHL
jgi:hypothetical protein